MCTCIHCYDGARRSRRSGGVKSKEFSGAWGPEFLHNLGTCSRPRLCYKSAHALTVLCVLSSLRSFFVSLEIPPKDKTKTRPLNLTNVFDPTIGQTDRRDDTVLVWSVCPFQTRARARADPCPLGVARSHWGKPIFLQLAFSRSIYLSIDRYIYWID
jgi:hypothetical protein